LLTSPLVQLFLMENHSATPITPELARSLMPVRPDDSHKGTFGKALVVAGSRKYTGAAGLAIQAALRSGVGLVYAAIPETIHAPLAASISEAIWLTLPEKDGAIALAELTSCTEAEKAGHGSEEPLHRAGKAGLFPTEGKDAILVGPGLDQTEGTQAFLLSLLAHLCEVTPNLPVVVDADAINILSQQSDWHTLLPNQTILTPHEMEFSRLTGLPLEEIKQNRQELAITYAQKWHQTLILKGANTLVVSPQGDCRVLPFANSVLAHGGTGDVLAGLLVGLLAQGLAPFDAATLAVWLHARAAELALEVAGHPAATLPSDIIQQLGLAMKVIPI
jgi:NAD(P)H-hydrate epimerase